MEIIKELEHTFCVSSKLERFHEVYSNNLESPRQHIHPPHSSHFAFQYTFLSEYLCYYVFLTLFSYAHALAHLT